MLQNFFFQLVDYRVEFTKWWVTEFKTVKFPSAGTIFDYFIDPETKKFEPWTKRVPKFEFDPDMPLQVRNVDYPFTCYVTFQFISVMHHFLYFPGVYTMKKLLLC